MSRIVAADEKVRREIFSIKSRRLVLSTSMGRRSAREEERGRERALLITVASLRMARFEYKTRLEKFRRQLRANLSQRAT